MSASVCIERKSVYNITPHLTFNVTNIDLVQKEGGGVTGRQVPKLTDEGGERGEGRRWRGGRLGGRWRGEVDDLLWFRPLFIGYG